ncbi:MAG: TonB family protein [Acidobacteria bacterium]|nr:TonB family protein [Acidobacteriota bacterium]
MKGISLLTGNPPALNLFFSLALILTFARGVHAQQTPTQMPAQTPAEITAHTEAAPETDAVQRRIARARTLAAVGKLAAAASELETLRASSDESVRDVTRVLLMWIFVEMPDYTRANALLDDAFNARSTEPREVSIRSYYALAGQGINGVRTHLERYRTFGLNIADGDLTAEANGDLNQLRALLERVVEHAKAISDEETKAGRAGKGSDATALLEDAASVRLRLARTEDDHTRWQAEVAGARQRLFSSETRIASISEVQLNRPQNSVASATAASAVTATGRPTAQKAPAKSRASSAETRAGDASAKAKTVNSAAPSSSQQQPSAPGASQTSGATEGGAKKAEGKTISVGPLIGKAKQRISPSYPSLAKSARVTGVVTVYLIVNEKGDVDSVLRTDGPPQLQQAAAEAARRWKFLPTMIDGQPARVSGFLSFSFAL